MHDYKIELKDGKYNLYSPKIGMYVIKDATMEEVKIILATEMEYAVKLDIVKMLITFPHGFTTIDDKMIEYQEAVDAYKEWYDQIYQRIGFLDEYYMLIDKKIVDLLM